MAGSAVLGYFYNSHDRDGPGLMNKFMKHMKSYSLFYANVIICTCFGIFYLIDKNIVGYLILAGVIGFFLGGSFNMFASNEVMAITNG